MHVEDTARIRISTGLRGYTEELDFAGDQRNNGSPEGGIMPQQETFFERETDGKRFEVLKTYDPSYAREAFGDMDEVAKAYLWSSLGINENYDATDLPSPGDPASEDFLWEELLDAAREDGNILSFFIVNEETANRSSALFVSPDWPSAESFAKGRVGA